MDSSCKGGSRNIAYLRSVTKILVPSIQILKCKILFFVDHNPRHLLLFTPLSNLHRAMIDEDFVFAMKTVVYWNTTLFQNFKPIGEELAEIYDFEKSEH